MSYLNLLRLELNNIKKKLFGWLDRFYIVKLLLSLKKKTDNSLLFFSLFILWGFFSVTISRGIAIWYFGWWAHLNIYLFTTTVYLFFSVALILKRYLQQKGHFQIFKQNQQKLKLYESYVCQKYKIDLNITFKRSGKFLLLSTLLFYNLFFYYNNEFALWILVTFSFNLFLYFLNSAYLWWFFFKTPMPHSMLLEPPKAVSIFFTKILKREYSTASKFWTTSRKDFIPVAGAFGAVIAAAITADTAIAAHTGETTRLQRIDDRYSRGWVAIDPKTRSKMTMLQSSGEDPSRYCNSEFVLDQRRVNIGYDQYKKAGFPDNFKADLEEK